MVVKLKDIARKAGVSVSTASNALNFQTNSRIKKETLERVNRIAAEMGYRPNAIARSLKFQRTDTIAFYTGYGYCDVRDRFLSEVVTGMQQACDQYSIDLLLFGNLSKMAVADIHRKLASGKVDGVVVHASPSDPVADRLAAGSLPAVAIADLQPRLPSVVGDDVHGMQLLVDYLWDRGHRRLGFLPSHQAFASAYERKTAFETLVTAKGSQPLIYDLPLHFEAAVVFLKALMADKNRPTALCCWHDDLAYFLLQCCVQIGIRVPDDLGVVGFDGLQEGRIPGRRLVTAAVPWDLMAFEAAANLIKLRNGLSVELITRFPVELRVGDTA